MFFLLFSYFSLDLSSTTIQKTNKTKKDKTKRAHVSQILIQRTKKTDNNNKNRHFRFTNTSKLRISIFWYFLKILQYKKQYKHSNHRFWKLVDRFPHSVASKFVFIIHFPWLFFCLLHIQLPSSSFKIEFHTLFKTRLHVANT